MIRADEIDCGACGDSVAVACWSARSGRVTDDPLPLPCISDRSRSTLPPKRKVQALITGEV